MSYDGPRALRNRGLQVRLLSGAIEISLKSHLYAFQKLLSAIERSLSGREGQSSDANSSVLLDRQVILPDRLDVGMPGEHLHYVNGRSFLDPVRDARPAIMQRELADAGPLLDQIQLR